MVADVVRYLVATAGASPAVPPRRIRHASPNPLLGAVARFALSSARFVTLHAPAPSPGPRLRITTPRYRPHPRNVRDSGGLQPRTRRWPVVHGWRRASRPAVDRGGVRIGAGAAPPHR